MPWANRKGLVLPLILLLLAGVPFLGFLPLAHVSPLPIWSLSFNPLATSVTASLFTLLVALLLGTPATYVLARRRGIPRLLFEGVFMLLLVTPPLVLGLLLAQVLGPYAWLGRLLTSVGLAGSNSFFALLVATFFEAAPYYCLGALSTFTLLDPELEAMAYTLGLSPIRAFYRVVLPEALPGLVMAASMCWARAMGAFGAVVVVAYHPYGLPLWTWVQLEMNGLLPALGVALLLILVAVPWPLGAWAWSRRA